MKRTLIIMVTLMVLSTGLCLGGDCIAAGHPSTEFYEGWRLGTQAYTFRLFTFYEAVDKAAQLGLDWIEMYPGQKICEEFGDAKTNVDMTPPQRRAVKEKLDSAGIRLVNFGVVGLGEDEQANRKVFEFARNMGIETIVSEPPQECLDKIDELCKEYDINVAIHNHPQPSRYWNPEAVLEACKGRSEYIGACADIGHWCRSGVDPVEAVKMLEGRIISMHFKDINEFGVRKAHDVHWGNGVCKVDEVLETLNSQGFKGVFSIEYEHNWENSVPDVYECIQYFNKKASQINSSGWQYVFEPDLSNAAYKNKDAKWEYEMGVIKRLGGGDICTKEKYADFVLDFGFKTEKGSNSGVLLRTQNYNWTPWIEVQILDSYGKDTPDKHDCGGIFDLLEPAQIAVNEPGRWNRMTIYAIDNRINVILNGKTVTEMNLDLWSEAGKNPDGSENKFKETAFKDLPREGYLIFQDHGQEISFRNIKILPLNK
ncbi:L-xylulose 5-phosphate 3-epimerase [Limihaloglobus sulfuriphilus]|uniref:L-xylulose 5-phosphate 3-epimerase n=1 Tax=Limihaloglobus sulfuriphilus TaxID=1851148 RepID=A0A1Q2ME15_9BACT|nr:family 16 glycoside hydrolase [Limihaloglobus sulfuriphilus]AQQ70778.1 L-xylulose 5-phosphate 3-epimerase [Limihaloglobus sulfuriphilus]